MKKLLIPLIAAFAANTVSAAAPQQVIDISTEKVSMVLTAAPEGAAWRAENLRLTRAAEALADSVPEALPLSDRWDDLCTLALVLGQRR